MGLGTDRTAVCWSASKAKGDPSGYEDERLSLIGDSFACPSFMIIAAVSEGFDCQDKKQVFRGSSQGTSVIADKSETYRSGHQQVASRQV